MPRHRLVDAQLDEARRRIRQESSRLRQRLDRDLSGVEHELRQLASWRTYVRRWPMGSVAASFAVGLLLSTGFSARRAPRWIGARLAGAAFSAVQAWLLAELATFWNRTSPRPPTPPTESAAESADEGSS